MKQSKSVFNPLDYPSILDKPSRLTDITSWHEHIPFAFWIVAALRPRILVELGTHKGDSYGAFCQAVSQLGLPTRCYAVDTWKGDEHAGFYEEEVFAELKTYHDQQYGRFSQLIRSTFDEALKHFSNGSIDLLHIDGLHTYDAVRHDLDYWLPKMSKKGVVLMHDINVHEKGFGVWRLWEELEEQYPSFEFTHGYGLGLLSTGNVAPEKLNTLLAARKEVKENARRLFYLLGNRVALQRGNDQLQQALAERDGQVANLNQAVSERDRQLAALKQTITERDGQITSLIQVVAEREGQITSLNQTVSEREGQTVSFKQAVIKRDEQIASLKNMLAEREGQITSLNQTVSEREGQITSLNQTVSEREGWIAKLTASRSWKLTKPLRFVGRLIRGEFGIALAPFRRVHRQVAAASALCRAVPRAVSFYGGSVQLAIRRVWGVLMREGISGVTRRANTLMHDARSGDRHQQLPSVALYGEVPLSDPGFMPKVSIIVPNFNHAKYLPERLESIYAQSYGNFEVILLDDCSSDESVAILRDYAERCPGKTICRFNKVNSGGVFNQWKKGLELATGELIWIAESDDWCSTNLLEELVRCFRNPAVMLAFVRSTFVRGAPAVKAWTSEEYLSDLDLGTWDRPFIQSAHALVKNGWAIKNLVPNVSSAVFRNPGKIALFDDPEWARMRLCGDWIFYLSLVRGGLVAYSPSATNYYRQHPLNTSVNAQSENHYYHEFEIVARHLVQKYAVERSDLEKQQRQLYQHWCSRRGHLREGEFRTLYDLDRVWQAAVSRKPNLVMAVYALTAGGGETFPIILANLLHDRGYAVTLLNFRQQPTEPGVQHMLSSSIPLLELAQLDLLAAAFTDMGVELVHSHHAWVDVALATSLLNHHDVRQFVTMHGMYEMMPQAQIKTLMPLLERRIDCFVYTAEKNLSPFPQAFRDKKRFHRIDNALPPAAITPVPRAELGLGKEDFVLCLVSRAMPDKGWEEAIGAVTWAHARSRRKIHLLLIGEGVEFERLRSGGAHDFVHFLGFRSNIRDYFATSDIGFLPSRFKGESFPLVLIDCLLAGKPILASDVGEIRYMLDSGEGLAGELFDLEAWQIRVEALGQIILTLANDPLAYQRLLRCVPLAAAKFHAGRMVDKYEGVYRRSLATAESGAVDSTMRRMGGRS